ncbi:MAG: hypothetical protein ACFFA4_10160 [Promethearchaeota archaeon]
MRRLGKLVYCGLIIILVGIIGYISTWASYNYVWPILMMIGLVILIIGAIFTGITNKRLMIGGILGLSSILLTIAFPNLLNWYRIEYIEEVSGFIFGLYITGFGSAYIIGTVPIVISLILLELFGGILILTGSIGCIFSAIKESRVIGIIGGILILLVPIIFTIDLFLGLGFFIQLITSLGAGSFRGTLFYGMMRYSGAILTWGVGVGFYICLASGIIVLSSARTI